MSGKRCCCGCCSVRDGTRIIAILSIIGGAFAVGQQVHNLMVISQDPESIAAAYPAPDAETKQKVEEFVRDNQSLLMVFFAAELLLGLVSLILSGLLLHGAQTNQESRCRPWLYFNFFFFAILVIFSILVSLVVLIFVSILAGILLAFCLAIPIAIEAYFLNVVREYILELRYGGGGSGGGHGVVYAPGNPNNML